MKHGVISFSSALLVAFLVTPLSAWAHSNPDFDDDAKPILKMQPGLLQYVESRFEVKDTGTAKFPGDDDRRPSPPFIFRARPVGTDGPYNLRLLIQPGPIGHILGVVDVTKVHLPPPGSPPSQPAVANQPPPPAQYQPAPQTPGPVQEPPVAQGPEPSASAPAAQQPSEPTADTPSGPIMGNGSTAPSSNSQSLAPPPDPAPANQ